VTAEALRLVFVFLFGSLLGSFLNVCIYRLPRDRSVFSPARSYCPICHQRIAWFDNVPILSWLLLGGCCRHCGTLISSRYAIVEALTASLFTLVYAILVQRGETWGVIAAYEALLAVLIASSFIDIELRIIPDSITLGGAMLAPLVSAIFPDLHMAPHRGRYLLFTPNPTLGAVAASLAGMAVGSFTIWATGLLGKAIFRREAMGMGDVKFMALVGGVLGWPMTLVTFFLAPVFGAVIGLIVLVRTRDHHIPYGPFLSIAAFVAMLWGADLLRFLGLPL